LSDQLIIAYLGRLHPAKGIDVLMRAFAGAGWPQGARLVIIGPDEGFRGSLTALSVELGIQEAVIFVDALRGRDKLSAYADSDLVVYAGQSESFGMVPIESLMCGTPVVISEACGCREVIEGFKAAHVVPYGDVGALIAEIERTALRGQVARAGAEEAREALSRLLSWESICEQYENADLRAGGDAPTITFHTEPSAPAFF
jgi:glycosyltransferase involved in cell wall biosynthesis